MPWECSLCTEEDAEEYPNKREAKQHVRDNHLETLVATSIEHYESDVDHGAINAEVFREA